MIPKEEGPTILECSITGNSAMWTGGGVQCLFNSFPEIKSSTISENSACWEGGGVFCEQSFPKLTNCVISGNRAQSGGGLGWWGGAHLTLTNCIISGNRAQSGGGLGSSWGASHLTLTNCTISGNMGGGVYCRETGKATVLTNCIVWGNAGKSIWPLPDDPGNSAVWFCVIEGEPVWPGENISNLDPRFVRPGAWDDNGTPDDPSDDKPIPGDYRLQPASSAIDAGMQEGAPTTDIHGHGRPCGAWVDIGAYEFGDCASPTKFRRADVDGNGSLEITDPIKLLGYEFLGKPTPTCLDSADANDDGKLDISDAIYSLSFQFLGGIAPESPFPDCGIDPVIDELDCESYPGCQ